MSTRNGNRLKKSKNGVLFSSNGHLVFDAKPGKVIRKLSTYTGCRIVRVDVNEWSANYPGEDVAQGHDILDFGVWRWGRKYDPPDISFRVEYALGADRPRELDWHERLRLAFHAVLRVHELSDEALHLLQQETFSLGKAVRRLEKAYDMEERLRRKKGNK